MLREIVQCFLPIPPKGISAESRSALRKDTKAAQFLGKPLDDVHRRSVDVWIRHTDNLSRAANREWLKERAKVYALRWASVSCVTWLGAWLASDRLIVEVPLTLAGFAAGTFAVILFVAHRVLNRQ